MQVFVIGVIRENGKDLKRMFIKSLLNPIDICQGLLRRKGKKVLEFEFLPLYDCCQSPRGHFNFLNYRISGIFQ